MPRLFNRTDVADLSKNLRDYIRVGEVSSIDPAKHTARVAFPDDDGAVSYDLPVLCRNSLENSDFAMPDVGEDVLCVFLPGGAEDGFILGSFYAGEVTPPTVLPDQRMVIFQDGTIIRYDRGEAHALDIIVEDTTIHIDRKTIDTHGAETQNYSSTKGATRHDDETITDTTKAYTLSADETISRSAGKTVSENAGQSITTEAGTTITITAGTAVTIKAPVITLDAPQTVITGSLTQGGGGRARAGVTAELMGTLRVRDQISTDADVVAKVSLNSHVHTEQGDGADTSGPK